MKKVLFLIITSLLLIMSINIVKADTVHPSVPGYTLVCEYEQVKRSWSGTSVSESTEVVLLYINNDYYNGTELYAMGVGQKAGGPDSYTFDTDVKLSDKKIVTGLGKYSTSGCPKAVYKGAALYCFDYGKNACDASAYTGSDGTTRSGSTISSTKLTHNVKNELSNTVKTKVKAINDKYDTKGGTVESPLCKGETPDNAALEKQITVGLDGVMKKYGSASFSDSAFQNISGELMQKPIEDLKSNLTKYLEECKAIIKNDENKTEEEKNKQLNELENGTTEAIEDFNANLSKYLKEQMKYSVNDDFSGGDGCEGLLGDTSDENDPAYYIRLILLIMRYAAVLLCVILSIADFFKAIINQDKDALMKAAKTSAYRLAFAIIIFFLPIVLDFILGMLGEEYKLCISNIILF